MENMTVSLQIGDCAARKTQGFRVDERLKEIATSPYDGEWVAGRAYALEFIRKGEIDMERYRNAPYLHGIGGWLTLFPIRLAAGVACLPLLSAHTVLAILYILVLGCCTALYCLRCRGFRTAYIVVAVLGLALAVAALPDSAIYLIAQVVVEAVLIPALYLSRRVKNTFYRCTREDGAVADGWSGREPDRSVYDVHFTTYRWTR